ncbi:MAG: hypothetical protein GY943_25790 [Chloroflexi bacterium]|nr:hypothetical protein [Chloroflexota bacterium]
MSFGQVPSMRHTVDFSGNQMIITIPARRQWLQILFLTAWLYGWMLGELSAIDNLIWGVVNSFRLVWLTFWTIGGFFVLTTIVWQLAGKEVITVDTVGMQITSGAFGVCWTKQYSAVEIQYFRFSPDPLSTYSRKRGLNYWGVIGGVIAFDYGSKTIRFGSGINKAEAKQIIKTVQQQFQIYS